MRQSSVSNFFQDDSYSSIDARCYQPFRNGQLIVKLPAPNSDVQLYIFNPTDSPALWAKYLHGLEREYGRMGVDHILDMDDLNNPASSDLAMVALLDCDVLAGMRFHGPLFKANDALVLKEMTDGNIPLLQEYIKDWLPENIAEPKGLWIDVRSKARKRLLQLMGRCSVYGAALLGCRYSICTSPKNITQMHKEIGLVALEEVGVVSYPSDVYETSFGYYDLCSVLENSNDHNNALLRRDWSQIQSARVQSEQPENGNAWQPLILDKHNSFHKQTLDSILSDKSYKQHSALESMKDEIDELLPPVSDDLQKENSRWVVYPWRNVAIELLGPKSFKRLRCDRNRNKITDEEQLSLATLSVGVVGLSTGHVIAHTMVMEGVCGHLKLADFDVLEVSNLNRIPASLLDIGINKGVATARRISELDPYMKVDVFSDGLQQSNIDSFMQGLDIVIEECDSLDVKVLVREAAIKYKIPVLMATSDGGLMDVERYDLDNDLKPFHGLTEVRASELKDLSRRDKSGYALAILEGEKISARLAASMVEIDHTVTTWAQLASDVTQGAAMVTTAVRRIGTGKSTPSSRTRLDMDELFEQGLPPVIEDPIDESSSEIPKFKGSPQENMLLAAQFAPSPGNIQPWKLHWHKSGLCFEIDRKRTTSLDIAWRGAMTALGAACFNAEVVAEKEGVSGRLEYFPDSKKGDLVGRFSESLDGEKNTEKAELYPYLLSRMTNRELSERNPIPSHVMSELGEISKLYPVSLHSISSQKQLEQYSDISIGSDRLRHLCRHLHQEMMGELAWPGKDSLEQGIDVRTLGLKHKDLNAFPILERADVMRELSELGGGHALGEYNQKRILKASAMAAITINGQSDMDYVTGGRALQHLWLIAEKNGLVVQPISPIFLYANCLAEIKELMLGQYVDEVVELKKRFFSLLNIQKEKYPVLVFRLSYAPNSKYRSLRRKTDR
jgi:molybdopterin/thiamine biosynthesis adenylyltransferase